MHTDVSLTLFLELYFTKSFLSGLVDNLTREMNKKLTLRSCVCKYFKLAADTTNFFFIESFIRRVLFDIEYHSENKFAPEIKKISINRGRKTKTK